MTAIADATGYTDQDNGQEVEEGYGLLNAPQKPGASPAANSGTSHLPPPIDPFIYPACPHCSEGREFSPCTCLHLT